ncbi:MAG: flap endonuclease-1 [Candidatus Aenigmarchaeota archaeon]|nr:flap endonuclease-1 [Candidatus Aenigmarchaeota archaeon]
MGVNIAGLVEPQEIEIGQLSGKIIAMDSLNIIYQFLSSIHDRFTGEPLRDSKGRVTSHLSGLFYRTTKLMENGIKPVFVFDGKHPEFKKKTQESRIKMRQEAAEKLKIAREEGDVEKIRLYAQAAVKLDKDMVEEAKKLLILMGIQVVQAPSEGEAQAAYMINEGIAWASGSQDWDSLLFGADRLVKNLSIGGKRKVPGKLSFTYIKPEIIELQKVLEMAGISQDQLIMLGILVGTDFNPKGVKGIGPKTALKLVKEKPTRERLLESIEWEFDVDFNDIFNFFKNPEANDVAIEKTEPDWEGLTEFLLDHDFSEERTEATKKRLIGTKSASSQKSLEGWFK